MGGGGKSVELPWGRPAETRSFIGPFLRFQSGTGPGDNSWTGSVLCLNRSQPAGPAAPTPAPPVAGLEGANGAANGAAAAGHAAEAAALGVAANAAVPQESPVLNFTDSHGGATGAGGGEQRLTAVQLDSCEGWAFWRFELAFTLTEWQRSVTYTITAGGQTTPVYTFWLPGAGQPMHWGYYSCNGMSSNISPDAPERKDLTYLWRDVKQLHETFPMHCMIGGGDQLYNDAVWTDCPSLTAWGTLADHTEKVNAEWTPEMEAEATHFYLTNYINCFCMPDFDMALAQIPQVMCWDDHDIWDGYGSYEPSTQECTVFKNLFRIARRFYLLFQQQTTDEFNSKAREFLGANDGSDFHFVRYMGPQVVLLGMDMRSQRTKACVMPQKAYDLVQQTVDALPTGSLHLVVLSGIPLLFPKIPAAESILGCMGGLMGHMPALKAMARNSGLMDRFDQPEILDDLVDGWVADVHTEERLAFIRMLQGFSKNKSLRVSILSGDAHVGGVGRLYSRPKIRDPSDDPLYMPQIISSAIVNAPPPHPVVKMLMRTNFASNVDENTREKMVRAFYPHHPRTDKLIAQRNWCDVSLVAPPFAPPMVPKDPEFGGLRFTLRVENPKHRRGYADETYDVVAPRHPDAKKAATASIAPAAVSSHV